jgi:hypothetical protein
MAHRRVRAWVNWAVRWGGIAVVAVVVCVYLLSSRRWYQHGRYTPTAQVLLVLDRGQLRVQVVRLHGPALFFVGPPGLTGRVRTTWREALRWDYHAWGNPSATTRILDLPLWPAAAFSAALSGLAWMRYCRRTPGVCRRCHYDLSGLPPGSPCPECASPIPARGTLGTKDEGG